MRATFAIVIAGFAAVVAGCGGSSQGGSGATGAQLSADCIGCHESIVSPVTGQVIPTEWSRSAHSASGVGCADCHEPSPSHPGSCARCHGGSGTPAGTDVVGNPDADGKCGKCHGPAAVAARAGSFSGFSTLGTYRAHFRNISGSYVSLNNRNACRKCHNPHDPTGHMEINREWAESGHGDINAGPWNREFKTRGTTEPVNLTFAGYCVRCHTATGYVNYVTSGLTDQHGWGSSSDTTKEVLGCFACHDNGAGTAYGWQVRRIPILVPGQGVRVYYNFSSAAPSHVKLNNSPVYYPDLSSSNVCVPCHAGRGIGPLVKDAAAAGLILNNTAVAGFTTTNVSAPSAHDFAAAATLFKKGYEFTAPIARNYANDTHFVHDRLGIANTSGTGTSGPCVTCHMKPGRHSFLPVTKDSTGNAIVTVESTLCAGCHTGAVAVTPGFLQAQKNGFVSARLILGWYLALKIPSTRNWENSYSAALYGSHAPVNSLGANFNNGFLQNEPGAYIHNPRYAKRLLYDSIDWLDDGSLNDSVESSLANAVPTVRPLSNGNPGTVTYPIVAGTLKMTNAADTAGRDAIRAAARDFLLGGPGGARP